MFRNLQWFNAFAQIIKARVPNCQENSEHKSKACVTAIIWFKWKSHGVVCASVPGATYYWVFYNDTEDAESDVHTRTLLAKHA